MYLILVCFGYLLIISENNGKKMQFLSLIINCCIETEVKECMVCITSKLYQQSYVFIIFKAITSFLSASSSSSCFFLCWCKYTIYSIAETTTMTKTKKINRGHLEWPITPATDFRCLYSVWNQGIVKHLCLRCQMKESCHQ